MKNNVSKKIIPLTEYVPQRFHEETIPYSVGTILYNEYEKKNNVIKIDFPTHKTDNKWQLTSQGWVGFIPCTPELGIALKPKIELENLFRMLEYAYNLESFKFLEGLSECNSLEDFYERLANVLAKRILDRGRKGYYRAYLNESENLPYIRGRVNIQQAIQTPWNLKLLCHYEEHTADIEENQILSWTLDRIANSGMCTERVLPTVRRAYHALKGFTTLTSFSPRDCVGRLYNRLNEDYHPLHALCRFFLEHSGPSHEFGDRTMLPFLVNMERLYERFVAEWLKTNLPTSVKLERQESVYIGEDQKLSFDIDMVLYDADSDEVLCVIDTKYKGRDKAKSNDVAQVIAYAEVKNCTDAFLVYPVSLLSPKIKPGGRIHVRAMTFSLDGDLENAGQEFKQDLFAVVGQR